MKTAPAATILIVDDEPRALAYLRALLEVDGYFVLAAANGPAALALAQGQPDVVLLDLMMPGMDGYEVCRRLRATPALELVPIIMLTALDDRPSKLRGLESGADDFLTKPFDATELRTRLRTITRLNRYRRLYEERARFEAALAHAPEGMVLTEIDGTILHRNAAFDSLLDPAGLAVENFFACLPAATVAKLQAALAEGNSGRSGPWESPLAKSRQPETVVEITFGLVPWEGRVLIQFHVRDLTESKVLESQLMRSQRIDMLGQLSGSIAHDMNNVLSAIGLSVGLIEMGIPNPGIHYKNIHQSVERGASMVRQLLAFAKGSDGEFGETDLAAVLREVGNLVRATFGCRFQIGFSAAADLPPVIADSTQVHQIAMNLCVNARDAMPLGGVIQLIAGRHTLDPAGAARAGADIKPGEYCTLAVHDTGTGIPPEILPRLFDPFFTTKAEGKGTGLGLATVMRLMRRHQGFVTIDTKMGQGSCFTCHFPVPPKLGAPPLHPASALATNRL